MSVEELHLRGSSVQLFELSDTLSYCSDILKGTYHVESGFVTDFGSIPRFFWRVLNPDDPIICWPSVIHDCMCVKRNVPRLVADQVLREAMAVQGAGRFIRNAVYFGLRLYNFFKWKKSPRALGLNR